MMMVTINYKINNNNCNNQQRICKTNWVRELHFDSFFILMQ